MVTQLKHWPDLIVSMKEDNEGSKKYMPIGVTKVNKPGSVKIGISMNCRPSTKRHLKLIKSTMEENTCIFYSSILARIINHKSHNHQLRIHYYSKDGGYMLIHCDSCGKKCTTLYQTVLYGENCGILLRVDPIYHKSNFCKLLMN